MKAVIAAAFATAVTLSACGGNSDTPSVTDTKKPSGTTAPGGGGQPAASGEAIVIKDFKFGPDSLKAKVGDKIKVTNNDSATHTLTAEDKSFDTKNLDEGASATITMSKAGTFEYQCNIHDYMKGTIEVS